MAHKVKTKWKRQEYRKDNKCRYCMKEMHLDTNKKDGSLATVDHIIPSSKDGPDDQENWILACESCNSRKADGELLE
jgi:5-methylcytosine-specific restriction endonuclease McrA